MTSATELGALQAELGAASTLDGRPFEAQRSFPWFRGNAARLQPKALVPSLQEGEGSLAGSRLGDEAVVNHRHRCRATPWPGLLRLGGGLFLGDSQPKMHFDLQL